MTSPSVQAEFADGPLEGTARVFMSGVAPERMWFAPFTRDGSHQWERVDHGDDRAPDPPWEGQMEYRRTTGPVGGVAIYRLATDLLVL